MSPLFAPRLALPLILAAVVLFLLLAYCLRPLDTYTAVENVGELRAHRSAANGVVIVAGHNNAGDGGGGIFIWRPDSTRPSDGGTIISSGHTGRGRWIRLYDGTLSVRWFGAKGDGSSDDTSAIERTLRAVGGAGGRVYFPPGDYITSRTIHIPSHVMVDGTSSHASRIVGVHRGASVISLRGSSHCSLRNIGITTSSSLFPATGLALGRSSAASAGYHHFENIAITGSYSIAATYSIASEENTYISCMWSFDGGGAKYGLYTSQSDDFGVDHYVGSSNSVQSFYRCLLANNAGASEESSCIFINGGSATARWTFDTCYLAAASGAYVHITTGVVDGAGTTGPIIFRNCGGELSSRAGEVQYGLRISGPKTATVHSLNSLRLENSGFDMLSGSKTNKPCYSIYADDNVLLNDFYVSDINSRDISLSRADNSFIQSGHGVITIRRQAVRCQFLSTSAPIMVQE